MHKLLVWIIVHLQDLRNTTISSNDIDLKTSAFPNMYSEEIYDKAGDGEDNILGHCWMQMKSDLSPKPLYLFKSSSPSVREYDSDEDGHYRVRTW